MELPKRPKGDEFTKPGEYPALRRRVRAAAKGLNIPTLVTYAFDSRTRLLPYYFACHRMAPAGARAIGSALADSGLTRTRVALQQWTPRLRPSLARLDGDPIEMLLISSMQIHAEKAYELVADACLGSEKSPSRNGDRPMKSNRPFIIAGGPKAIYEPWDMFGIGGDPRISADVVVTGEEFIFISLLEVLLGYRGTSGNLLDAFNRARRDGALSHIPGLVFRQEDHPNAPLVTTGIQRLVADLDEMPEPILGFKMLEKPHRGQTLKAKPLPASSIWRVSPIASITMTHGCKFNCDYCPIPAFNQKTYRHKSGARVVTEMRQLREELGIRFFFGTDDNFFNHRESVSDMFETMSRATIAGKPIRKVLRWGTEATEFDTWRNKDLLPWARKSGLRAIWFGIEDMTATLIKKGQSVNKTQELFSMLNGMGICPMPMIMHHDGQPLYSRTGMYGLLNQVEYLRKCGAQSLQVTVLTPAVGSRSYEANYEKGLVFDRVGNRSVLQHQFDGNHAVASASPTPWWTQLNVLAAYATYYNPVNFVRALVRPANSLALTTAADQARGMIALGKTALNSASWAYRLFRGPITRRMTPPGPIAPLIDISVTHDALRRAAKPLAEMIESGATRVIRELDRDRVATPA